MLGKEHELDFDNDTRGSLVYWDCVGNKYQILEPGMLIKDGNLMIGKVGKENILPNHFSLRQRDLHLTYITDEFGNRVGDPVLPGVSAFVFFGSQQSKQDSLINITLSNMGREPDRQNKIYISQVGDMEDAGWRVFYVPLINLNFSIHNPLHVLIVPNSIAVSGEFKNATEDERQRLAGNFVPWKC